MDDYYWFESGNAYSQTHILNLTSNDTDPDGHFLRVTNRTQRSWRERL
ncbi:MAG: hypothetical protein JKP95_00910 [Oceanicaulis sp.]|nr:hypothetical protein [Oceanicaulis sp.]